MNIRSRAERGEVTPIYQSGIIDDNGAVVREQAAPEVPTVKELYKQIYGKNPSGPVWDVCKLLVGTRTFGKALLLPPKTPDEIVKINRNAVAKMVKDSKFLKESDKLNPGAPHFFGQELARLYPKGVSADPQTINYMKKVLNEKYGVVFN